MSSHGFSFGYPAVSAAGRFIDGTPVLDIKPVAKKDEKD